MATGTAAFHAPCWTELGSTDPEASKAFYSALFGWSAHTDPRPEAGGYTMMQLGEEPVAAISPQYAPGQPTSWTISLKVKDADAIAQAVERTDGKALMPPMDVFDMGRFAVFADPDGAVFSVWQPRTFEGTGSWGELGSLGWVELSARDPKQAAEFYRTVFAWTAHDSESYTEWSVGEGDHFGGMMDLGSMGAEGAQVPAHWKPYFAVQNVDAAVAKATAAGATVLMPPIDVPGQGPRIALIQDPQGGAFGVFEPMEG
jgi:uncharacterized protein